MHASILFLLSLLGIAFGQDDGAGGCESGSITANRCCDGDVISSDGAGIDTSDISNLVCCVGSSGSGFSLGGTSCSPDQTSVPFSELSTAGGASQGATVIVSNDSTMTRGATIADTLDTSTMPSSAAEETPSAVNTTGMAGTESQAPSAEETSTDTSTGAAVLMTSGPMAGALVMAGGFMMAAL